MTHDLEGELLCQITERPIVRIRILGRSEMPDCECHTTLFSTGNNVTFASDMTRRGLTCNLETLEERPEFRGFKHDALALARADRPKYVAAALTVVRAYLVAGAPTVCGPLGSYTDWSRMARSPLVWLGEPDPVLSMDGAREEDPVLTKIREFFDLWPIYLRLDCPYTTARIIEIACEQNSQQLRQVVAQGILADGRADTGKGIRDLAETTGQVAAADHWARRRKAPADKGPWGPQHRRVSLG